MFNVMGKLYKRVLIDRIRSRFDGFLGRSSVIIGVGGDMQISFLW